jgi:hypothetical protein
LWEQNPTVGAEHFITAATLARGLLKTDDANVRASALALGANGAMALWSQGRRPLALELTQAFSEAAENTCGRNDPVSEANCLTARAAFQHQLAWADDPRAVALLEEVRHREAAALEREPDSSTVLHDALWAAFEQGDFVTASRLAERLREHHLNDDLELGDLATVLSGRELPTDSDPTSNTAPLLLARALQDAAHGRFAEAAINLHAIEYETVWYQMSWTPHPRPALTLPAGAQPAFETFLTDFTGAYGEADAKKLGASIEALATAFEQLAP